MERIWSALSMFLWELYRRWKLLGKMHFSCELLRIRCQSVLRNVESGGKRGRNERKFHIPLRLYRHADTQPHMGGTLTGCSDHEAPITHDAARKRAAATNPAVQAIATFPQKYSKYCLPYKRFVWNLPTKNSESMPILWPVHAQRVRKSIKLFHNNSIRCVMRLCFDASPAHTSNNQKKKPFASAMLAFAGW